MSRKPPLGDAMELDEFAKINLVVSSETVNGLAGYYRWQITGRTVELVEAEVRRIVERLGSDHALFSAVHRITDMGDIYYCWQRAIGYTENNDD